MVRIKHLGAICLVAITTFYCCVTTRADDAFSGSLLIFAAKPEKAIEHGIQWQGPIDPNRRETLLAGPTHYAANIGGDLQTATQDAVFNWYRIEDAPEAITISVKVWTDQIDASPDTFQLGAPVYFLSMSQRIATGAPAPTPEGRSHFVAYRIVDGKQAQRAVSLPSESKPLELTLKDALVFCVPVEEWHHHQHFPIKNSSQCLVVYEIGSIEAVEKNLTALDQFGLHSLELGPAAMLGVPAKRFELKQVGP